MTAADDPNILQVTCTVTANPIAEVFWTKGSLDGERLSTTGSQTIENQVEEVTNTLRSTLCISNQGNLSGTQYFCVAENVVGTHHDSISLPVADGN